MAYAVRAILDVYWIGDGTGQMSVPSAQKMRLIETANVPVPGGDAPSQANFNTAITGTVTTDLEALIAANLTAIQGWATGGN